MMERNSILAMGKTGVNEIKDSNLIPLRFQQLARISKQLPFRIEGNEGSVGLHDVRLCIEAGFARAAAADDKHV